MPVSAAEALPPADFKARDLVSSKGCSRESLYELHLIAKRSQSAPTRTGKRLWLMLRQSPVCSVLLFAVVVYCCHFTVTALASPRCRILRLHRRCMCKDLVSPFRTPTRLLPERVSYATLDWSILRKGYSDTIITT